MKDEVHHVNQLTDLFMMMCISPIILQNNKRTHTELFRIFFSLLTLSIAFIIFVKRYWAGKNYVTRLEIPKFVLLEYK